MSDEGHACPGRHVTVVLTMQPAVFWGVTQTTCLKVLKPWSRIALIMYLTWMCVIRACCPPRLGKCSGSGVLLDLFYLKLLPWLHTMHILKCNSHTLFKYNILYLSRGERSHCSVSPSGVNSGFHHGRDITIITTDL